MGRAWAAGFSDGRRGRRGLEYEAENDVVRVSQGQSACVVVAVGGRNGGGTRGEGGGTSAGGMVAYEAEGGESLLGTTARSATTMGRGKQGAATGAPQDVNMGSSWATT